MFTENWRLIAAFVSYLIGSVPFGYLIGLSRGVDIRKKGSGNIGATNVKRILGGFLGTLVLLLDILKAGGPAFAVMLIWQDRPLATLIGACAMFGHCFSPFLKFGGGKGVACLLGVALATNPVLAIAAWVGSKIVKSCTLYVSLASMSGAVFLAIAVSLTNQDWLSKLAFVLMAAVVIYRHRDNIVRLRDGEEPQIFKPDIRGGFTINPETTDPDYYREKIGKKFLPFIPISLLRLMVRDQMVHWLRSKVGFIRMGKITGFVSPSSGRKVEMMFYATTKTADELKQDIPSACRCIIEIVLKGIDKKIRFWGLGGFTSIVTAGGAKVAAVVNQYNTFVTSGNSLTAYSAFKMLLNLAEKCGYFLAECTVTIIGGRGSIGLALAKMLSRFVGRVILVGRPGTDLNETVQDLRNLGFSNVEWNSSLQDALSQSLLVVSVASTTADMDINPDWFSKGTIVVDVSRPRTMGQKLAERHDILVVAGGIWLLPAGTYSTLNFGLHPREALACMAETLVLMAEGRVNKDHSIGPELDADFALEIGEIAYTHGLSMSRLRDTDDKPVTAERLESFFSAIHLEPEYYKPIVEELTKLPD